LLIGTNSGLDFVPLTPFTKSSNSSDRSRGSVHTVKPISLIKKTRFKSLKVLEVRSNILLAIAGRNDHLRGMHFLGSLFQRAIIGLPSFCLTTRSLRT
jgi:hypothetical protein